MSTHAIYDATGRITQVTTCPAAWGPLQTVPAGGGIVESTLGVSELTLMTQYCVVGGQLVPRVSMGLGVSSTSFPADGTSQVVISGIPAGAQATITGAVQAGPETILDGELVITSTSIGAINCTITCPPAYFDWSIPLNAT